MGHVRLPILPDVEDEDLTLELLEAEARALLERFGVEAFTHVISKSQVENHDDCARKWAWRSLDKEKGKPNPYADLGKVAHDILEVYLEEGKLPPKDAGVLITVTTKTGEEDSWTSDDFLTVLTPGFKHLPRPKTAKVEGEFFLNTVAGLWRGYKDYRIEEDGVPVVGDHKTTSDITRYALVPDEEEAKNARKKYPNPLFREDLQVVLYVAHEMDESGAEVVRARWGYFQRQRKKPRYKSVERDFTCQEIDKAILPVLRKGLQVQADYLQARDKGLTAKDFPPNPQACKKYGGCNYEGGVFCNLTDKERLRAYMANNALKEKMRKKMEAKSKGGGSSESAPTDEKPKASGGGSAKDKLKAKMAAKKGKGAGSNVNPPDEEAPKTEEEPKGKATSSSKPKASPKPAAASPTDSRWILYVNCAPVKGHGPIVNAHEIIGECVAGLVAEHGCHYRLIEDQYGGAPAILGGAVSSYLEENPPDGAVVLYTRGTEATDALAAFMDAAPVVVQGLA